MHKRVNNLANGEIQRDEHEGHVEFLSVRNHSATKCITVPSPLFYPRCNDYVDEDDEEKREHEQNGEYQDGICPQEAQGHVPSQNAPPDVALDVPGVGLAGADHDRHQGQPYDGPHCPFVRHQHFSCKWMADFDVPGEK